MQRLEISGERVKQRREELGLSQKQLAEIVGVTQQAIQVIERGGVRKPRFINELARALQIPVHMIQKDFPDTMPEDLEANNADLFDNLKSQMEGVQIAGFVESGVFRRSDLYPQKSSKRASLSMDNRYLAAPQYAWEIRGDGMDGIGLTEGMLVLAGLFEVFVAEYNPLKDASVIIVERHRQSSSEIEISLKQVAYNEYNTILRSVSNNSLHDNLIIKNNSSRISKSKHSIVVEGEGKRRPEQIEIIAVVLSASKMLDP